MVPERLFIFCFHSQTHLIRTGFVNCSLLHINIGPCLGQGALAGGRGGKAWESRGGGAVGRGKTAKAGLSNPRGGYNSRGGHGSTGGHSTRGGYDARGGHNSRGGYDSRGGHNPRGGYDSRGGRSSRGGNNFRGGYNLGQSAGSYTQSSAGSIDASPYHDDSYNPAYGSYGYNPYDMTGSSSFESSSFTGNYMERSVFDNI